ncbi:oocyte zinc finger protein XlCOF7.1 isoform X2 [Calliphora vicina]|uniref:oocyte zinc finger protein XlCOF7.1 isoform X2 n=1 Tax=Calliphora vicina TaxID=7373 RepID=UPI00325B7441
MSATSFVMPNDLSDLCRVCLQLPEESQYLDLATIYDEEDNLTYGECFTICTHIDLNAGEGVPHHLCKSCGLELQMSYDFHKKIEESKRVIEQCQKQIYEQKANVVGAVASIEQPNNVNSDALEEMDIVQLINNKYEISDDEDELAETSQELEEMCGMQHENEQHFEREPHEDEETDEMDIINRICQIEANTQLEVPPDKDFNTSLKPLNDHDIEGDEDEMEDYQNLEALEDEVTETIQINVTKYNIIECGENDEYAEDDNEGVEEDEEYYTHEPNEDDMEEQLRWQNNVVAVASKEHLPINIEDDEETEEEAEEETIYKTAVFKKNENQIILEESLQDENVEQEEDNENDSNTEASKKTSSADKNSNNNNTSRKRHVGSYSCDYCQRVYPNYSRMKTHRRCHETDRPKFSCSHCGRMYATKQARDCHIQTAHEKSGYNCSICSKVFAIRKSLEIHVRYHTGDFPYACKLCDRKFAQACHLNTHVNVKHNKIRFSCDYPGCGKFFTSSTSLRNHEFTHGIMPFECEYCQQGFPAKAKLRIHIQRKHGMDLSKDQLENMRKFHVMRSKVNLVQFVDT